MGKKSDKPLQTSPDRRAGWATAAPWLAAATLILAGCLAYANSFKGVFLFDDETILLDRANELWPPGALQWSATAVPDFTFCLNYYFDKFNPAGWHAVNLAVHLLAGLTLFGLIRRTMLLPEILAKIHLGNSTSPLAATILAAGAALLWMLHPLQTESVTYIVQRQTAMMGLFYLLTIYCLLRGSVSQKLAAPWYIAAVLACALGMRSKQVMVTAPLMALLFDRTFLAGTFKRALRLRWPLYIALACTWALLYVSAGRVKTEEARAFFREGFTNWQYAVTQFGVIVHYLRLSFWPDPLCLDYAWPVASGVGQIVPPAALVLAMLAVTVWALVRHPKWGFLGAWFFVILAPTSSVLPLSDPIFEHRMYLSLAAVTALVVLGGYFLLIRRLSPATARGIGLTLVAAAAVALGWRTYERNKDYSSAQVMWTQAIEVAPLNPRAHNWLALTLASKGEFAPAVAQFSRVIEIQPSFAPAYSNLGLAQSAIGRMEPAIENARKAAEMFPNSAETHDIYAQVLSRAKKYPEAIEQYQVALSLRNDSAETHFNFGNTLAAAGDAAGAEAQYRLALQLRPNFVNPHVNLATLLAQRGDLDGAIAECLEALRLNPSLAIVHNNLASLYVRKNEYALAAKEYEESLRLDPNHPSTLDNYARLLAQCPRDDVRNPARAVELARLACRATQYFSPRALETLALALAQAGRLDEAADALQRAAEILQKAGRPDLAQEFLQRAERYRARPRTGP